MTNRRIQENAVRLETMDGAPATRRGSARGMAVLSWMLRHLPRRFAYLMALCPVVYYYVRWPECRRSTLGYQRRLGRSPGVLGRHLFGLRQAAAYSRVILDNVYLVVAGKRGFKIRFLGTDLFRRALERGRGLILLSAHAGNWHLAVNFLDRTGRTAHLVTADVRSEEVRRHMDAAKKRSLKLEVHDAGEGPSLALRLKAALCAGDIVVLAGDRAYGGRELTVDVLGSPAAVPALGFALATATSAPLCVGLAFSTGMQRYDFLGFGPLDDALLAGTERESAPKLLAQRFADILGEELRRFPHQWFNFHDFWAPR